MQRIKARLMLVDLAGSERASLAQAGSTTQREVRRLACRALCVRSVYNILSSSCTPSKLYNSCHHHVPTIAGPLPPAPCIVVAGRGHQCWPAEPGHRHPGVGGNRQLSVLSELDSHRDPQAWWVEATC